MTALRVGIAGLGTVGAAVAKIIVENGASLSSRSGRALQLTAVSARDRAKDRGVSLTGAEWFADPVKLAQSAPIDVFVELMGGEGDPRRPPLKPRSRAACR
jgi:homoserine dehydrogenase